MLKKTLKLTTNEQIEYARAFMNLLDLDSGTHEDDEETIIKLIGEEHLNQIIEARDTLYQGSE